MIYGKLFGTMTQMSRVPQIFTVTLNMDKVGAYVRRMTDNNERIARHPWRFIRNRRFHLENLWLASEAERLLELNDRLLGAA